MIIYIHVCFSCLPCTHDGIHKGGRPPKAAASLGVGGRRPPQVPGKRLLGPFFDLFGTIGVAFNCSGFSRKAFGTFLLTLLAHP